MASAEFTVIGGGILGLSCAFEAARRGARVTLYEQAHIGAGASGGFVGALAPHVPEKWNPKKQFQLESLLMAAAFWADVEAISGMSSGYARLGRLQAIGDEAALGVAKNRAKTAKKLWNGLADWRIVPASGSAWEPQSSSGWLIYDTLSARVHPRLACAALARALSALGGEVIFASPPPLRGLRGPVVWATGVAGLRALNESTGRTIGAGVKGQAFLLGGAAAPDRPQIYADGLHIIPHEDGTIAVGSTSENTWDAAQSTDEQLTALHARALSHCPALAQTHILERWAGVRPRARSRAPLLGAWPALGAGHYVLNGGFKIGFGMAPKLAEVSVDLALENRDTIPDDFRLEALL